jgi:hypothetical protein
MSQIVRCPRCSGRAYDFGWGIRCGECRYESFRRVKAIPLRKPNKA